MFAIEINLMLRNYFNSTFQRKLSRKSNYLDRIKNLRAKRLKGDADKSSLGYGLRKRRSGRSGLSGNQRPMRRTRHGLQEARWSREVRERDNETCQFPRGCNKQGKSLDTHHIALRSLRPDLRFVTSNGITLCRQHHRWVHANRDEAVAMGLLNLETYEAAQKAQRELAAT